MHALRTAPGHTIWALLGLLAAPLAFAGLAHVVTTEVVWLVLLSATSVGALVLYMGARNECAQLRQSLERNQLAAAQHRRDPHFLNNALNSLCALIEFDPPRAEQMTIRLAEYYRMMLRATQTESNPLSLELELAEHYLQISSLRFGQRLRWQVEVDATTAHVDPQLPSFALQPLVENAVVHGIASSMTGGLIKIVARCDGDHVRVSVENPLPEPSEGSAEATPPSAGNGTALRDLHTRLKLSGEASPQFRIVTTETVSNKLRQQWGTQLIETTSADHFRVEFSVAMPATGSGQAGFLNSPPQPTAEAPSESEPANEGLSAQPQPALAFRAAQIG